MAAAGDCWRHGGSGVGWARRFGLQLSVEQLKKLAELRFEGPTVHGWDDARWTLARVAEVIERRFGVSYTLRGVSYLLHRVGYSQQVPTRRAVERDREAIAG
ncbi:winged helix-turn-helix domain-containing protein [Micromonospora sp. NPDC005220]|uniref:helix-turn-helix domain-containing protein n=1 Tax=Micromonospora sp. NPDC005220 TaxID=3155589 RepID=UPI0033A7F02A